MENASQALLIAAGVLIGILILSLGIALMNIMGGYAANTQSRIDENKIAQFNDKFLKYNGLKDLNIQDIITVKNYALENNRQYTGYSVGTDRAEENNAYIDVYYDDIEILGVADETLLKNEMEKLRGQPELESNRFTCEVQMNTSTGRVFKVYFYETKK